MNLRAIGIVLIAVLATLLAIAKLDNITAAMGILGAIAGYLFGAEAKDTSGSGSSTGVNATGAQVGDNARIAGRDINDTINNIESMLGDLKGLTNATVQNMQVISESVGHPPLMRRVRAHLRWESEDENFIEELTSLPRSGVDDWTQRWIDMCLEQPACTAAIREAIAAKAIEGWNAREIDFDNHGNGVHVSITFEREFALS